MPFFQHFELEGKHSYLSPSTPHWLGYDDDKFDRVYLSHEAKKKGDRLHKLAALLIRERVRLEDNGLTLNMYVNESIGFRMTPEQTLFYSDDAFGTADAIGLFNKKLRISDLKTGVNPTSIEQLECYAALYCLEYRWNPFDLEIELRIYQNDEVRLYIADPGKIRLIMEKYEYLTKRIAYLKEGLEP